MNEPSDSRRHANPLRDHALNDMRYSRPTSPRIALWKTRRASLLGRSWSRAVSKRSTWGRLSQFPAYPPRPIACYPCPVRQPAGEDICAIIVTHHPDSAFAERIATLQPQVGGVVVVDNASNPEAMAMLRRLAQQDRMGLIENATNQGVATGLNQGVEYAKAHGFSWFITFDQDSSTRPPLIESLRRVCASVGEAGLDRLGVLGANHIDGYTGELFVDPGETVEDYIERKTVITAGSLMSVQSYDTIGPFRDDFFIDGIDDEYCLRARSKGYRVLLALAPHLVHSTGHRQVKRVFPGVRVMTVNHAPFRWYTMVRNRLIIVREYAGREPSWTASRALRLVVRCARTLTFEKERIDKARCMALGLADFASKRKVRHPVELIRD